MLISSDEFKGAKAIALGREYEGLAVMEIRKSYSAFGFRILTKPIECQLISASVRSNAQFQEGAKYRRLVGQCIIDLHSGVQFIFCQA
jgi:hypothetical protein